MKQNNELSAFFICIFSFLTWGMLAIYWSQLKNISPVEIVAHRAVWSLFFAGILVVVLGQALQVVNVFRTPKLLLALIVSSTMIGCNWTLYIWAVINNHIVETSMGYYINPLLNVAASALIFKVKINKFQKISILLATLGVINLVVSYGSFPIVGITLAASFCVYGIIRKIIPVDAMAGLFVETFIIAIPSVIYIAGLVLAGKGAFYEATRFEILLLVLGGIVTTLPLAGFSYGAKNLNLNTVGVLQYLSPTTSFLIGVFMYNETFTSSHLVTFIFIWLGLAIYTIDGVIHSRKKKQNVAEVEGASA